MTVASLQRRVGFTFLDQAVSSTSNFATGVVVARVAGPARFGDYMLAATIWLVVVGFHRAVITEPLIVVNRDAGAQGTLARGVGAELMLGAAFSVVVAAIGAISVALGASFGALMVALSPWLPALLLQDYWRSMAFQQGCPGKALLNDLVFAAVQAAAITGFLVIGARNPAYVLAGWGIGATAGAALGFLSFPATTRLHDGWVLLRQLWPLSRWMLADFSTALIADYAALVVTAVLLSRADYGGYRAALSLMGPTVVILHAAANAGLPEASRRIDREEPADLRALVWRLSTAVLLCVGACAAVVALAGEVLLRILYGQDFEQYGSVAALVALGYLLGVCVFGVGIALKATGRMRLLWRARALVGVGSLLTLFALVPSLGVTGAGWATVTYGIAYSVAVYAIYRYELCRSSKRNGDPVLQIVGGLPAWPSATAAPDGRT